MRFACKPERERERKLALVELLVCMNGCSLLTKSSAHPFKAWLNSLSRLTVFATGAQAVEAPLFECVGLWGLWRAYPLKACWNRMLYMLTGSYPCQGFPKDASSPCLTGSHSELNLICTTGPVEQSVYMIGRSFLTKTSAHCKARLNRIPSGLKLYLQGSSLFSLSVSTGARLLQAPPIKKVCLCSPAYEHDPRTTLWSPLPSMEGCLLSLGPEAFPLKARIWKQPLLLTVDSFQEQGLVSFESLY